MLYFKIYIYMFTEPILMFYIISYKFNIFLVVIKICGNLKYYYVCLVNILFL